jgi:8-oxo-dGTP pyrophosphatase MutT (NUDIX family)
VELRHILSARRPAGLRELSAAPPAPSGVEAGAWDADWLRARLAGPDPVSEDPAFAWADDAALAADIPLAEAAVLVALITGERPGVLLTKRSSALRRHGGQVSFPGGRIDPEDASPEAAALREAQEEIGLDPLRVKVAGRLTPYVTGTGYRVTPVVGTLARGFTLTLSPFEVESVLELPLETLLDSTAPQRRSAEYLGRKRLYWVWPHPDHEIWGATAAILVQLAQRLRASQGRKEAVLF